MPESYAETVQRVADLLNVATQGETAEPVLERLRAVRQVRRALDAEEAVAMRTARAAHTNWAEIGEALGMSGQAAGQRARAHHQIPDTRPGGSRPVIRGPYRPPRPAE